MGAAFAAKLLAQLQGIVAPLGGPLGIAICTVGIAGAAIAVLGFHRPPYLIWMALFASMIILGAGTIAAGGA